MKLPFPRSFNSWLVAFVSLTAVALVSIAPMMRTRAQSPPTTYTITDLGTLGGVESRAFAINSCGQIAGFATLAGESKRPFFRPSSSLINLGVLSGDGIATSLNNSGQVVGYSPTDGSSNRAFIWHDDNGNNANDVGEMKQLLPIGAVGSAEDINDNGKVVGWIQSDGGGGGTGGSVGFVWENNNFQLISGSPAHPSTLAHGVNNAGAIVGEDSELLKGFILRSGVFIDIPAFPTGTRSVAYAVSESDHVVGAAAVDSNASPTLHAFIWTDGGGLKDLGTLTGKTHSIAYNVAIVNGSVQVVGTSYSNIDLSDARAFVWQDLNGDGDGVGVEDAGEMKDLTASLSPADPTWTALHQARSINSSGQIVGFGLKSNGETHAFLLTPPSGAPSACLPTVSVSVSPSAMNEDAAGSLTYTFTRSITTGSPLVVNFSTTGTANSSSDYSISQSGSVTILANQQSATVTVDPATDADIEPNETVILTTTAGAGYNVGTPTSATGTINNDDSTATVSVAVSQSPAAEDGATDLVYTFTRSTVSSSPLIVSFATTGTAAASDYAISHALNVTIPANTASATVTVDPSVDTTDEPDETVILTITADAAYTIAASPQHAATGTITDDDATPTIQITNVTAPEPSSGSTSLVFVVSLTNPSSSQITVNYATDTTGATATGGANCGGGVDFFNIASTGLTFAAGETSKQVFVTVCTDTDLEPDETFFVNLSGNSPNSVLSSTPRGTGTITPQTPAIFTEEGNGIVAAAVDSVTFARGPFRLINNNNLTPADPATRIIIFTSNLGMTNANLASGILSVCFNGSAIPLANIEHVGPVGVLGGSYIIVKLPALPTGSNTLTVKMGGAESNAAILSITP